MRMRLLGLLLLFPVAAAQEESPFGGETRDALDPEGRIKITVPASWKDLEVSGTMIIRVNAPQSKGGHDLIITREGGQSDVDKQRDRYLQYDGGRFPAADVEKVSKPFFGYRIHAPDKKQVLVRAFVDDGPDGIVISVSSRIDFYDKYYKSLIETVVSSVGLAQGAAQQQAENEASLRRVYDKEARVSLVVPALWKPIPPEQEAQYLVVALKGAKSGPKLTFQNWGGPASAALTLTKIFTQWKRVYAGVTSQRLGNDPPRLLVSNRTEGSLDYLIAFEHAGEGYTLQLTVREGSYEKLRPVADEVATTVVFTEGGWQPAVVPDEGKPYKKSVVVHAPEALAEARAKVLRALPAFDKHWKRVGIGDSKKKPPLHVIVVKEEDFETASHRLGRPPAVYDRALCAVVVAPPPPEDQGFALWRGRLYAALAEAAMHRDMETPPPPWLRAGLAALMEGAGNSGGSPEEGHAAYAERLELKTSTDSHKSLKAVLAMTNADFILADTLDPHMYAWGYLHLMLYGRGTVPSVYRRWIKDLEKAKGEQPEFDLGSYDKAETDLKEHVQKRWGK